MSVIEIDSFRELDDLVAQGNDLVVKFWATWCGPCRQFDPHYKAAAERSGRTFVAVDVDKPGNADLVERYSVKGVPTVLALDSDGERRLQSRTAPTLLNELGD